MSDMTRSEAIEALKQLRLDYVEFWEELNDETTRALDMAIASLEADKAYQLEYEQPELCEDCISRFEVTEILNSEYDKDIMLDRVDGLPSVLPKAKKGHWIEHECEGMREKGYYRCSVCNHGYQRYTKGIRKSDVPYIDGQEYKLWNCDNYCPNCGAKMVESQESEDKE